MRRRFFFPIILATPLLAACGSSGSSSSSGAVGAANARASAIASAEAHSGDSPVDSSDASSTAPSSAPAGPSTCGDQTINGYTITDVKLQDGATCAQLAKVAASPQIGGQTFEWAVDGFHCASATDTLYTCDLDDSSAEIDFTATKQ